MHASVWLPLSCSFGSTVCAWADVSMASEIQHGVELYAGLHSPGPRYGLPSACFDKASKSPSTGRWAWALACISSRYYAPVHAYRPLYCTLHAYRSSRTVSLGRVRRPTWGPAPQHSSQKIARARVDEVRFIGRHFMREMQGHYSPGPQYRVPGTTGGAPGNYFASTHNLQAVAERHGTGRRSLSAVQLGAEPLFSLTAGSFSDPKRAAVPTTPGDTAAEYWRRATTLQTSEVPSFTRDVEKQPWSEAARGPNLYGDEVHIHTCTCTCTCTHARTYMHTYVERPKPLRRRGARPLAITDAMHAPRCRYDAVPPHAVDTAHGCLHGAYTVPPDVDHVLVRSCVLVCSCAGASESAGGSRSASSAERACPLSTIGRHGGRPPSSSECTCYESPDDPSDHRLTIKISDHRLTTA